MPKSDYVFEQGEPIDVGTAGDHDFVFGSGESVTDRGVSDFVFESGTGIGGSSGGGQGPWRYTLLATGSDGSEAHLYDCETDTWEQRSSPPLQFSYTDGANLNGIIYSIGGDGGGGGSNGDKAVAYEAPTDTWYRLSNLPEVKDYPSGASAGGYVYSVAGADDSQQNVYRIGSVNGDWAKMSKPPRNWEGHPSCTHDGSIYIGSGDIQSGSEDEITSGQAFRYDPETDSYTRIADVPNDFELASMTATENYVWSLGGIDDDEDRTEVRRYDPGVDEWTTNYTPIPEAHAWGDAIYMTDGMVHVFGGNYNNRMHYAYDPVPDTWETKPDVPYGFRQGISAGVNNV